MKIKLTLISLFLLAMSVAGISQDNKKPETANGKECRGPAFFIGEQKDRFVTILGTHSEEKDTVGGKLMIWEHLGVKLYIDDNDKIVDYSFMKAKPEAGVPRRRQQPQ